MGACQTGACQMDVFAPCLERYQTLRRSLLRPTFYLGVLGCLLRGDSQHVQRFFALVGLVKNVPELAVEYLCIIEDMAGSVDDTSTGAKGARSAGTTSVRPTLLFLLALTAALSPGFAG